MKYEVRIHNCYSDATNYVFSSKENAEHFIETNKLDEPHPILPERFSVNWKREKKGVV